MPLWYVFRNPPGDAGLNLMREPAQRYQDTLYRFLSQASKGFAVTIYRIDEMQMLKPTEGYSYVISTSSNNPCVV